MIRYACAIAWMLAACQGAYRTGATGGVDASSPPSSDASRSTVDAAPELVPSNSDALGGLTSTGLTLTIGTATFDTDTECTTSAALGTCTVVPRVGLADVCACRVDVLTVGSLRVSGSRALAILAFDSVAIQTSLDVSANGSGAGPGSTENGGSFGSMSGLGIAGYGTPDLIPLVAGSSGAGGGSTQQGLIAGGGGGGAVQISAGQRIDVSGAINAGGGGGAPNTLTWPKGSDGGSGGALLLEAPVVSVTGSITANGAGGGGSAGLADDGTLDSLGGHGAPGVASAVAAAGGYGGNGECAPGGTGGNGSVGDGPGQPGPYVSQTICEGYGVTSGGNGGGAGRIRINSTHGCDCNGTSSPTPSYGQIVLR